LDKFRKLQITVSVVTNDVDTCIYSS